METWDRRGIAVYLCESFQSPKPQLHKIWSAFVGIVVVVTGPAVDGLGSNPTHAASGALEPPASCFSNPGPTHTLDWEVRFFRFSCSGTQTACWWRPISCDCFVSHYGEVNFGPHLLLGFVCCWWSRLLWVCGLLVSNCSRMVISEVLGHRRWACWST